MVPRTLPPPQFHHLRPPPPPPAGVKSDCKEVIDLCPNKKDPPSDIVSIIADIRCLASNWSGVLERGLGVCLGDGQYLAAWLVISNSRLSKVARAQVNLSLMFLLNSFFPRSSMPKATDPEGSEALVHVSSKWEVAQGLGSPRNNLTGEVSTMELRFFNSLTNCKNLEVLEISLYQFNGILPASIMNLSTSFCVFEAFGCQIKGEVPIGIGNLSGLTTLLLDSNELTGFIPSTLERLENPALLYLEHNDLKGSIPNDLCRL
ncbi:hypothetical protein LguiB_018091 [Lonicera macranthoides]